MGGISGTSSLRLAEGRKAICGQLFVGALGDEVGDLEVAFARIMIRMRPPAARGMRDRTEVRPSRAMVRSALNSLRDRLG